MPLLCSRSDSGRLENQGNRRENGTERTSTMAVTLWSRSIVMKLSSGRFEWPMVRRLVSNDPVIGLTGAYMARVEDGGPLAVAP